MAVNPYAAFGGMSPGARQPNFAGFVGGPGGGMGGFQFPRAQAPGGAGGAAPGGFGGILGAFGGGGGGDVNSIIRGGQQAGFFDPMGSSAIRNALRQNAIRTAANRMQRGQVLRQMLGLDPQQQRAAQLGLEQQSGSDLSNSILGADLGQMTGAQDYIRNLFSQRLAGQQQMAAAKAAAKAQNQGGVGNFLGRIAGGFIPGLGGLMGGGRSAGASSASAPSAYDFMRY